MDKEGVIHGWVALVADAEVFLEHGVPTRIWVAEEAMSTGALAEEIRELTGLQVTFGSWEAGEGPGEREAALHVSPGYIGRLLEVLAHASAEAYYDRYHKAIDADATDYDAEAYAQDFNAALEYCGLHWGEVDKEFLEQSYLASLHRAADEIARHAG